MKLLIAAFIITFSLGAIATENPTFDSCAHYRNKEAKLQQELDLLIEEARKLDSEGNYYPNSSADDNCEEVGDEATYIARRMTNVRQQLVETRRSAKEYCNSGRVYPE